MTGVRSEECTNPRCGLGIQAFEDLPETQRGEMRDRVFRTGDKALIAGACSHFILTIWLHIAGPRTIWCSAGNSARDSQNTWSEWDECSDMVISNAARMTHAGNGGWLGPAEVA